MEKKLIWKEIKEIPFHLHDFEGTTQEIRQILDRIDVYAKSKGYDYVKVSNDIDPYGDDELLLIGHRYETDQELKIRQNRMQAAKDGAKIRAENRRIRQEEEDKANYKRLHEKYGKST